MAVTEAGFEANFIEKCGSDENYDSIACRDERSKHAKGGFEANSVEKCGSDENYDSIACRDERSKHAKGSK